MSDTMYHTILRVSALTLSLVLLFVSGVLSPVTQQLSKDAGRYVASTIGMNASVTPNELNTLSAQLEQRNRDLSEREIAVSLKEGAGNSGDLSTFILSALLFVLLLLIIFNYVLDYLRGKLVLKLPQKNEQTA